MNSTIIQDGHPAPNVLQTHVSWEKERKLFPINVLREDNLNLIFEFRLQSLMPHLQSEFPAGLAVTYAKTNSTLRAPP
jgi:hypothetical protein